MRRSLLALAVALLPVPALAEKSPLSTEIATAGIAATEARLAALSDPAPPDLFALAGLRFLRGVERALQLRWQTGLRADWSELPILRLPIPENPDPRPFTGADLSTLLEGVGSDMGAAREALDQLGTRDFVLEIAISDLWFDINANGTRDEGEAMVDVAGLMIGGRGMVPMVDPAIRFDTADGAWLYAYTHFLSAASDVALAYDPAASVDRILASAASMKALWGTTPPPNAFDMMFGKQVDRVAIILQALKQEPDAQKTRSAHKHLLGMIEQNRRFWALAGQETDNDKEWVPAEGQVSGLGLMMPPGTAAHWQAVLAEAELALTGEVLVPHWRYGAEAGINLEKLFENPPPIDLIGMIQGEALLPYAEKGPRLTMQSWNEFSSLVMGDEVMFAIFLN